MFIYRYEKSDKGGPYFTLDGYLRTNKMIYFDDDTLYGCVSLKILEEYFKDSMDLISDCHIVKYDVPDNECIIQERQVIFPKKYSN